jgi:hypothetical protein
VPIESALEVLDSDFTAEDLPALRRDRRTDEELVQEFWEEIGYPTPASRFWEKEVSPSSGNSNICSQVCRDGEDRADAVSPSSPLITGSTSVVEGEGSETSDGVPGPAAT